MTSKACIIALDHFNTIHFTKGSCGARSTALNSFQLYHNFFQLNSLITVMVGISLALLPLATEDAFNHAIDIYHDGPYPVLTTFDVNTEYD